MANEPIAIVGIGVRLPGDADTPEAFWQLLADGASAIAPQTPERRKFWLGSPAVPPVAGFLRELSEFDASFFGISPREAIYMDPQQRMLLEVAWEALENAGHAGNTSGRTGVFVGIRNDQEYAKLQIRYRGSDYAKEPYYVKGSSSNIAAARLSKFLDANGPSISIDTGCSSSLVAAHLACGSLRSGESDLAVVAGVHALILPESLHYGGGLGLFSRDDSSVPLLSGVSGAILGEGCGVVVLERLSDALARNSRIYAVIQSTAVNHEGAVYDLFTGSPRAKCDVMRQALIGASRAPEDVGYLEAHGMGASPDDRTELEAIATVFHDAIRKSPLRVGSAKANIGHLVGAAGIAGLIKTALSISYAEFAPHPLAGGRLLKSVEGGGIRLASREHWPQKKGLRTAGVSSFGWGGGNAHVVMEEAPVLGDTRGGLDVQLFVVSARTEEALRRATGRLVAYLRSRPSLLADVAYTLQVGRKDFEHRRAVVCRTVEEAIAALELPDQHALTGRIQTEYRETELWMDVDQLTIGSHGTAPGEIADWEGRRKENSLGALLTTVGRLWVAGARVNWNDLYKRGRRRRVPLPTYPFERKRYWVGLNEPQRTGLDPSRSVVVTEVSAAIGGRKHNILDWFYTPVWRESKLVAMPRAGAAHWLVLLDSGGIGEQLAKRLEQAGHRVTRVAVGSLPDLSELAASSDLPQGVVHLCSLDAPQTGSSAARFEICRELGFASLLRLGCELGQHLVDAPIEVVVASRVMQAVLPEEAGDAEQALLPGLCKVIGQENVTARLRCIDVEMADEAAVTALAQECLAASSDLVVAYRNGRRYLQSYVPLQLGTASAVLREQGVYLITGGLGGIGQHLAQHLAQQVRARLVLVGRTPPTQRQRERIAAMERLGAEVLVLQADVGDVEQLGLAVTQARARFGDLNGVVHAAGVTHERGFAPLQELSLEQCAMHFRSKVYGLYALETVLQESRLDFCMLCSSLSAVLGGLGFAAYAAANSFMDAFAHRHNRLSKGSPWTSVNWDTWQFETATEAKPRRGATVARYEMLPEEAVQAFELILGRKEAQIVNSTGDLEGRIQQWVRLESLHGGTEAAAVACSASPTGADFEERIATVWRQVLGMPEVGLHENFFEIGGNSLVGLQLIAGLKKEFKRPIPADALFEAPTVSALAAYLRPKAEPVEDRITAQLQERRRPASGERGEIAIIAMVGRFPGADNVDQFWANLRDGVESISHFSDEELLAAGVELESLEDPNYVKARPTLNDVEHFDAALFGYTPREAELMDPQQRLFQECAWEALEAAGYDPQRYPGLIGVYGGTNLNFYMMRLATDPQLANLFSEGMFLQNDKDALTLNVSYRLNLRGPSVSVQTFCSTSLVATHMACRALRAGDCDLALAGGVSVRVPVKAGYLYQEGDQVSLDGHCRSFDAAADGTTFGDGVAIVVLKRLSDALKDGDHIHAVIKGSAINNDGALKVGYTAPSVVGQAAAVEAALADAEVSAESIDYVEAHGSATRLGDPVEVASLSKAFRAETSKRQFCILGSVKPNVGHLDRAAGVSGLIKTVLALEHEELPATLHYERANPEIDFENSPFYVLNERRSWRRGSRPRRACVNSLGVGGTNAHVVIEEAPVVAPSDPSRPWQLLLLSARSEAALQQATERLRHHLQTTGKLSLADAAYTLQVGRRVMEHRRMLVCRDANEALELLAGIQPRRVWSRVQKASPRRVAMVFAGVGEHYPGWGKELYDQEPTFRTAVDRCCRLLEPHLGSDLAKLLFAGTKNSDRTAPEQPSSMMSRLEAERPIEALRRTALAQPAAFVINYALAQLWMSWGVRPAVVLGYSVGEYVAACLSGILSLENALHLVARRAQVIEALPPGTMMTVSLDEVTIQRWLSDEVELAAVNSPAACVVAGPAAAIASLRQRLQAADIACRPVEASHAFHTTLLRPAADALTKLAAGLKLQPARIPCLSNVTGDWRTAEQANDPAYWAEHMCRPVRFADGVGRLLQEPGLILLEIGPGGALSSFVRQHPQCSRERMPEVLSSLPPAHERQSELASLLTTLGKLWLLDVQIDWEGFHSYERRHRVSLPTYPFERRRFWLEPKRNTLPGGMAVRKTDIADWFDCASWKRAAAVAPGDDLKAGQFWLVLMDECGVGTQLLQWLQARGQHVVTMVAGTSFAKQSPSTYTARPTERADYEAVLQDLESENRLPSRIVHLWTVGEDVGNDELQLELGFYSLLSLTQALGDRAVDGCRIDVVSNGMHEVVGTESLVPARATVIGPVKAIAQEYPNFSSRSIDITLPIEIEQLGKELLSQDEEDMVALRGSFRWVQRFDPMRLEKCGDLGRLRERGVYLITGGLGGIALGLAEDLALLRARLVLVGRTAQRTAQVDRLEALGAEVLVQQADVAEPRQIEAAVQAALTRFGTIHGVLHTAGVPGIGLMQLKAKETAAAVLRPKVQGTLALARALEGIELDFLVLFSSITSATGGGPGQVDYCAANAFLDAWARQAARQHRPVTAISWGEWQWDAWQEGLQGYPERVRRHFIANRRHYGISFVDGAEALRRILANRLPHVFVTTRDLTATVAGNRKSSAASMLQKLEEQRRSQPRHPRPDIGVPFVAPRNETETVIAEIWEQILGNVVGVNEHFLDLGGNSLIAVQLISRMRLAFQVKVSLSLVFDAPTVAEMAVAIELALIEEIEELDEREARQLIDSVQ